MAKPTIDPIIRAHDVAQATGLSYGWVRKLIKRGEFPEPLRLGPVARGWYYSTLRDWIEGRWTPPPSAATEEPVEEPRDPPGL